MVIGCLNSTGYSRSKLEWNELTTTKWSSILTGFDARLVVVALAPSCSTSSRDKSARRVWIVVGGLSDSTSTTNNAFANCSKITKWWVCYWLYRSSHCWACLHVTWHVTAPSKHKMTLFWKNMWCRASWAPSVNDASNGSHCKLLLSSCKESRIGLRL